MDEAPDHHAQVDEAGRRRRQRDIADLAAESAGLDNGRMKRFRPATEAALRAERVRQGLDGRMTMTTAMLAALAAQQAWDNQLVTVAGVTMTNAERQTARKRVLDNPEHYYQWARQQGLVSDRDQWEQILVDIRRLKEIDDLTRANNGVVPSGLQAELDKINARSGAVGDLLTVQARKDQKMGRDATAEQVGSMVTSADGFGEQESARSAYRYQVSEEEEPPTAPYEEEQTFPSAPVLAQAWDAAQVATVPLDRRPEQAPTPADPVAAGSGLSF